MNNLGWPGIHGPRDVYMIMEENSIDRNSKRYWYNVRSRTYLPTTSKNPQANVICERMHQTVGNLLRTLLYSNPPRTVANAADLIDQALGTAMHAMRTNIHTILKAARCLSVWKGHVFRCSPDCRLASNPTTQKNNSE